MKRLLPFKDNSIDMILISHTLCLIKKKEQLVKEMHRVLKKGSWIRIIDNPTRFCIGNIPTNADIHTIQRKTLIEWMSGFKNIKEVKGDETQIDKNLLATFEKARAKHTSFSIEAQKK